MSDVDEIRFACPGCGSWGGAAGAGACPACGHRFEPSGHPPMMVGPTRSGDSGLLPRTFRIGPATAVIAAIAVGLGAFREHPALGVMVSLVLVPSTARTLLVAGRRRRDGRPMGVAEQSAAFVRTLAMSCTVLMASCSAFAMTGLAAGVLSQSALLGLAIGTASAIATGVTLTKVFLRSAPGRPFGPRARDGW